jgi:hypothetical protein
MEYDLDHTEQRQSKKEDLAQKRYWENDSSKHN